MVLRSTDASKDPENSAISCFLLPYDLAPWLVQFVLPYQAIPATSGWQELESLSQAPKIINNFSGATNPARITLIPGFWES